MVIVPLIFLRFPMISVGEGALPKGESTDFNNARALGQKVQGPNVAYGILETILDNDEAFSSEVFWGGWLLVVLPEISN